MSGPFDVSRMSFGYPFGPLEPVPQDLILPPSHQCSVDPDQFFYQRLTPLDRRCTYLQHQGRFRLRLCHHGEKRRSDEQLVRQIEQ